MKNELEASNIVNTDLQRIDYLIRQGEFQKAKDNLKKLKFNQLQTADMALLYRRLGNPYFGLRRLKALILEAEQRKSEPDPQVILAYSACLNDIQCTTEASARLNELSPKLPYRNLFLAFTHFADWRYGTAIPLLKSALNRAEGYEKILLQVNLCASFLGEGRSEEAFPILLQLSDFLKRNNYHLLWSNVQELKSQYYFQKKQYDLCMATLSPVIKLLGVHSIYNLYAQKWKLLSDIEKDPERVPLSELQDLENKAAQSGLYEVVRDLQMYRSIYKKDSLLLAKVFYGTASLSYQRKLRSRFGSIIDELLYHQKKSKEFLWYEEQNKLKNLNEEKINKLNKLPNPSREWEETLSCSLSTRKWISLLTEDLYRPVHLGRAFSHFYPSEYFDSVTSLDRMKKLLRKTRQEINKLPFEIRLAKNFIYLRLKENDSIKLPLNRENLSDEGVGILKIMGQSEFDFFQALSKTGLSKRRLQILLSHGSELVEFNRRRLGPKVLYRAQRKKLFKKLLT